MKEKQSPTKAKVYVFSLIKKGVTSRTWKTAITKENYIQRKRKNNNKQKEKILKLFLGWRRVIFAAPLRDKRIGGFRISFLGLGIRLLCLGNSILGLGSDVLELEGSFWTLDL